MENTEAGAPLAGWCAGSVGIDKAGPPRQVDDGGCTVYWSGFGVSYSSQAADERQTPKQSQR